MSVKRAIVIDDERLARLELKKLLQEFSDVEVVDEASNADEGIEKIEQHNPDIVFLDINMPGKTGFELLQELDAAPHIIFTTAYDEYAVKAFDVNALDYLLKPIDPKRLADAITKLNDVISASHTVTADGGDHEVVNAAKHLLGDKDQVFVKDGERCWFVSLGEIRLFESVGNYAKVYFGNNKPLILKSLNALEERLDEKIFFRANRKHIVNLRMIEKVESYFNGGLMLELKGGDKVEVSRRQAVRFKEMTSL